jgi:glycosyltransferase involved in cell wall biosynthesis
LLVSIDGPTNFTSSLLEHQRETLNLTDGQPLVSIVIPAFNCREHIADCIESALSQTYSSAEIIVVDDGSTDDTLEKLQPYVESGRVQVHKQTNRGPAAARNAGVRLARGKYLQFLDAGRFAFARKN